MFGSHHTSFIVYFSRSFTSKYFLTSIRFLKYPFFPPLSVWQSTSSFSLLSRYSRHHLFDHEDFAILLRILADDSPHFITAIVPMELYFSLLFLTRFFLPLLERLFLFVHEHFKIIRKNFLQSLSFSDFRFDFRPLTNFLMMCGPFLNN